MLVFMTTARHTANDQNKRRTRRSEQREDLWWEAGLRRDASFDGAFILAGKTTGIYCRPSCPARKPNRANVTFYATAREAEAAGFRPCKRCRPGEAALRDRQTEQISKSCRLIEGAAEPPKLAILADAAGLSPHHFHRVFKAVTGVTPKAYASAQRQKRLRDALSDGARVTEAAYDAGFNSSGRFYANANGMLGMTPSDFRSGGKGADLRFAVAKCALGNVLVAASDIGIAAIELGDDPKVLMRDFSDRFPNAKRVASDPQLGAIVADVVRLVDSADCGRDLPLDIRGTVFQRRVWEALRAIPTGTTATYAEVAERIGQPNAGRAVAAACAANKIAVVIPCHRVVRSDGTLSGYRWGVERKRKLIDREKEK